METALLLQLFALQSFFLKLESLFSQKVPQISQILLQVWNFLLLPGYSLIWLTLNVEVCLRLRLFIKDKAQVRLRHTNRDFSIFLPIVFVNHWKGLIKVFSLSLEMIRLFRAMIDQFSEGVFEIVAVQYSYSFIEDLLFFGEALDFHKSNSSVFKRSFL